MKSVLSAVVVAAAAMLGGAGPANAAVYQGNWDPLYGGIFPELGWQASALFDVPEPCLALGNAANVPITGSCAGFTVLNAKVELYDKDAPDTILGTYNLSPNVNVNGVYIAGGQLAGIDTGYFNYFVPELEIAGSGSYSFHLILLGVNRAQLVYTNPIETSPGCVPFGVPGAVCGSSMNVATGVFTPVNAVPEPETYALMLAGLGAVSFIARRRRRR